MDTIDITFLSIIYSSADYLIVRCLHKHQPLVCRGQFSGLVALGCVHRLDLSVTGTFTDHPKFGRQFQVVTWGLPRNTSQHTFQHLLSAMALSLPEPFLTYSLTDLDRALDFLECRVSHASFFQELSSPSLIPIFLEVARQWSSRRAIPLVSNFVGKAVSPAQAQQILSLSPDLAQLPTLIRENPYLLTLVPGFTLSELDALAGADHPYHAAGTILFVLTQALSEGHTYLPSSVLTHRLRRLLDTAKIAGALARLVNDGFIVNDTVGVFLQRWYHSEYNTAVLLAQRLTDNPVDFNYDVSNFVEGFYTATGMQLSDEQVSLLYAAKHRVLCLTGLPGTGKTTCLRALVSLYTASGRRVLLLAPTGIAAKRLSDLTGHCASTVHRALRGFGENWEHNKNNPLDVDAVILDEASMLDQEVFYRLLDALPVTANVCFVGDPEQLPSVSPGHVLVSLKNSPLPKVHLSKVYRQRQTSGILQAAHSIVRGEYPENADDFKLLEISDESAIAQLIIDMSMKLHTRGENFQVLSPRYAGLVGIDALNTKLQQALNPSGPELRGFRLGDRVVTLRNDYDLAITNGEVGRVADIRSDSVVVVLDDGHQVVVESDVLGTTIKLAYCLSVHKSQGCEFGTVIVPWVSSHGRLLQRNVLYTAVTRAKQRVFLLGEAAAVRSAVRDTTPSQRFSALGTFLSEFLSDLAGHSVDYDAAST